MDGENKGRENGVRATMTTGLLRFQRPIVICKKEDLTENIYEGG
jgi:hypothetical protein